MDQARLAGPARRSSDTSARRPMLNKRRQGPQDKDLQIRLIG
jgi:hypothetical protein